MRLSKREIIETLTEWNRAWNRHDLDGVMKLFHDDVLFENWTGAQVQGKSALRRAWAPWFDDPNDFVFVEEETFIDESEQKVLFRWQLNWPSREKGFEGKRENRRGVDVIHFKEGKIIKKLTYSKTTVDIGNCRVRLAGDPG